MALINPVMPTAGQPRGGEETDLQNAVQALLTEFNGSITFENLAASLQARFAPPVVTALPAGVDGQEINLLVDSVNGIVWRLKYRAASASAYKWEFIGGSELFTQAVGNNLASAYPSLTLTIPSAGDYLLRAGLRAQSNNYPFSARMRIFYPAGSAITEANFDTIPWVASDGSGAAAYARFGAETEVRATLAAGTVTGDIEDIGANPQVFSPWLVAKPVRIG